MREHIYANMGVCGYAMTRIILWRDVLRRVRIHPHSTILTEGEANIPQSFNRQFFYRNYERVAGYYGE